MIRVVECEECLDEVAATIARQLGRLARLPQVGAGENGEQVRWLVKPAREIWW